MNWAHLEAALLMNYLDSLQNSGSGFQGEMILLTGILKKIHLGHL